MSTSPEKLPPKKTSALYNARDLFDDSSSKSISSTHTDEMVIALCGPIGSPIHRIGQKISELLQDRFGYEECKTITLSNLIEQHANKVNSDIPKNLSFDRITAQIDTGNKLREKYGNSILAELAIMEVRVERESYKEKNGASKYETRRICHIIDSIKNKEELDLLRLVYRDMIYVVGVFSPLALRESNLKSTNGLSGAQVHDLIDRDSGEESKAGQSVADTFPNSDFFLRIDTDTDSHVEARVLRFLHLILGTQVITPTPAETAMYSAAMASANSACLSRQVGAAITDSNGDILGIGWNDVPKFGGGLYIDGGDDKRCWNVQSGKCFNDEEKGLFAEHLIALLYDVIPETKLETAKNLISQSKKLGGLIEFSRAIHAEMHAIINAAKAVGHRINKGKMYVTTYPCHSCARHIIAAGIEEVFYIEPYRKSLAIKLHGDDITEEETDTRKVRILAYDGVAPSKYLALFKVPSNSRKKNGKLVREPLKTASPRMQKSLEALPALEALVVTSLKTKKLLAAGE